MNGIIQTAKEKQNEAVNQNNETKAPAEKPATDTPVMTEEEMKNFISVLSRAEAIQGDYVYNGFIFFFRSIYEVIKESPVAAQNLMFHLQQFVFDKTWESFYAFDAHRNKAHLIFRTSEPFIDEETEEETEQPSVSDEPETEELKAALTDRQKQTLQETAQQIEMAMQSETTPQGVKDCLYTIIFEASNEAGLPLGDMSLVHAAFPNIIEALPEGYGRGIYHSVQEILRLNTTAFDDFYEQKLDEKQEDAAQ